MCQKNTTTKINLSFSDTLLEHLCTDFLPKTIIKGYNKCYRHDVDPVWHLQRHPF